MRCRSAVWAGLWLVLGVSAVPGWCEDRNEEVFVYRTLAKDSFRSRELREIGFFAAHPATGRYVYRWTTDPLIYGESIKQTTKVPRGTKLFTAAYDGVRWWHCDHSLDDPRVVPKLIIYDAPPDQAGRPKPMRGFDPRSDGQPGPYPFYVCAPLNRAARLLNRPAGSPTCFAEPIPQEFQTRDGDQVLFEIRNPKADSGTLSGELDAEGRIISMDWKTGGGGSSGGPCPQYILGGCEFRRDPEGMPLELFNDVVDVRWSLEAAIEVWCTSKPARGNPNSLYRPEVIYAGRAIDQFVSR